MNYTCAQYNLPQQYIAGSTYVFTCTPLDSDKTVVWRTFREYDDVVAFAENRTGFEENKIMTNSIFEILGDNNQTLRVKNSNRDNVAFFYVPSFVDSNDNSGTMLEEVTAETLIYGELKMP